MNEPWFGSWPPELNGKPEEQEMSKERWSHYIIPILIFITIGLFGYFLLNCEGILSELGVALITASIIGLAIELTFVSQLAKKVFEISFGYLLPPALKPGLRWIYGQKILCISHEQTTDIKIHPDNPNVVIVETDIKRTFENISGATTKFPISLSIEEHFRKEGNSEILQMSYCQDNEGYIEISDKKHPDKDGNLLVSGTNIRLNSKSKLYISSKTRILKHITDISSWHFSYATIEPEVTVNIPQSLGYIVGFEYAGDKETEPFRLSENTWKLPTTLLPKHPISIHWWKIEDLKQWQEKAKKQSS